ncbi:periplasmic heavy metal sensor [Aestuariicoccus sp. MJ-SS9]|uniref:periplasmic heavy metal sensor n=1 Tax=Aestuariicoccus sp. MJ-SS9 TaxID=3079855 RepID=UPI00290B0436|nr:periplasmic heavy metal sensor [Aestuariicoccus sp. MJ-SS9]MDU8909970.1 periplasmic heavy metal sensor [Aestuariicoccus sp. MJ-SS9]
MADATGPKRGMTGWIRAVLFASLALNLLIAGIAAGMYWRGGPDRGPRDRDFAAPYARALGDEQRGTLRRALRREFLANRPERGALAQGYVAASAALRAEPFDRAALEAVLEGQARQAQTRQEIGRRVMIDFLSNMSAEDRAAFADRLDQEIDRLSRRAKAWQPRD